MREAEDSINPIQQRSFDRLINFTDAIVAIAATLQILPLADIEGPKGNETLINIIVEHSNQIFSFILSFIILMILWQKHNKVFNIMRNYDSTIFWLNAAWILTIVFLPWPTSMYGASQNNQMQSHGGVGLLYWSTMATISGLGSLIALRAWSKTKLLEKAAQEQSKRGKKLYSKRGFAFFLCFIIIGISSELSPGSDLFLAAGLIPLSIAMKEK